MKASIVEMKPITSSQTNLNNPTNANEYQERIESLILQLSKKEAEQNSKRQKCTLFATQIKFHQDEITKLRSQVNSTMEELHLIDDDIEELTKKKDRLVLMMNKSSHGNNNINNVRKRGGEGEDYNDDELFMHTQYAQNMTQLERMEGSHNSHNDVNCNEEGKNDEEKKNDDNNNNVMTTNSFSSKGTIMKKNSKLQSIQTLPIIHRDGRNDNTKLNNDTANGTTNNDNNNHDRIRWTSQKHDDNYDDIEEFYDDDEHEPPSYLFNKQNCNNIDDDHNHHNDDEGDDQNCIYHTMTVVTTDNTITTARKHDEPTKNFSSFSNKSNQGRHSNTIDNYFQKPALISSIFPPSVQQELNMSSSSTTVSGAGNRISHVNTKTSSSSSSSLSVHNQQNHHQLRPQSENNRPSAEQRNEQYLQKLSSDTFPWSNFIIDLLHNTFKIRNFRDHQKQIINCTLSGDDAFVIMRTGG